MTVYLTVYRFTPGGDHVQRCGGQQNDRVRGPDDRHATVNQRHGLRVQHGRPGHRAVVLDDDRKDGHELAGADHRDCGNHGGGHGRRFVVRQRWRQQHHKQRGRRRHRRREQQHEHEHHDRGHATHLLRRRQGDGRYQDRRRWQTIRRRERRARRRDHGDHVGRAVRRRQPVPARGQADAAEARGTADQHEGGREHGVRGARHRGHAHHHRAHHTARAQGQVPDGHEPVQDRDAQGVRDARGTGLGQGRPVPAAAERGAAVAGQLPAVQATVAHVRAEQLQAARTRRGRRRRRQQAQEATGRQGVVRVNDGIITRLHVRTRDCT